MEPFTTLMNEDLSSPEEEEQKERDTGERNGKDKERKQLTGRSQRRELKMLWHESKRTKNRNANE